MRLVISHNMVVVPHKLNGASGLAGYPVHLLAMSISFINMCNGVKYGIGVPYNLILREPNKLKSKPI